MQLQPQGIWLRCDISHKVFWPFETGDFNLGSVSDYTQLAVEGPSLSTAAGSGVEISSSPSTSFTNSPVPCIGDNSVHVHGIGPTRDRRVTQGIQWPGFRSVVHQSAPREKRGVYSLKVVAARFTRTDGGKPQFEKLDQIYVSITEATANQPFILAAIHEHLGDDYIVVTSEVFEVKESNGTEGVCMQKQCTCTLY